ncbi:TetR family transcriptional regulator [Streptomyces sp. MAR4 CNY-716]
MTTTSPRHTDRDLPLRERKKQRTRHALAATALALFTEKGFDTVSLDELCDEVEVSKRTFFRYFSSKESCAIAAEAELWQAGLEECARTPLDGPVLDALRTALVTAITGMSDDWDRRFLTTRRLIGHTPALRAHSLTIANNAQERFVTELEGRLGRDGREEPALRLVGEIAIGAYRVGAKNWAAGRGEGGRHGHGGRTVLARRVGEAFGAVPNALRLTAD